MAGLRRVGEKEGGIKKYKLVYKIFMEVYSIGNILHNVVITMHAASWVQVLLKR